MTLFRRTSTRLAARQDARPWIDLPYLSLVDLDVATIVPNAAGIVQVAFAVSVVATAAIVVGAVAARRRGNVDGRALSPAG